MPRERSPADRERERARKRAYYHAHREELRAKRALARRQAQVRKLHQRRLLLDQHISAAESASYEQLCYTIGRLAASCGLTAIPLPDLEVYFERVAEEWEKAQQAQQEAEP